MEPSLSIQIIWPLAAEEAISSAFESIEPVHLFSAALKFVELEEAQCAKMLNNATIAELLVRERDVARARLLEHGIKVPDASTEIRHALRRRFGKGGYGHRQGRTIHRSDASREMCNRAEESAQMAARRRWEVVDLLECLLQAPGTKIAGVLAQYGAAAGDSGCETPLLDEYGREVKGSMDAVSPTQASLAKSDPVCKVIVEHLFDMRARNVLLIQAGKRTPRDVVESLAAWFGGNSPPKGAMGKRIVEVSLAALAHETKTADEVEDRMAGLLREAVQGGNVILWLSAFHLYLAVRDPGIIALLKGRLSRGEFLMIASTEEEKYLALVKADRTWQSLFQPVWLHNVEVLTQL